MTDQSRADHHPQRPAAAPIPLSLWLQNLFFTVGRGLAVTSLYERFHLTPLAPGAWMVIVATATFGFS